MRIERYQSRQKGFNRGCGCLVIAAGAVALLALTLLLIAPVLPGIALQVAGFEAVGDTDEAFRDAPTPLPPAQLDAVTVPGEIIVSAGTGQSRAVAGRTAAYEVVVGESGTRQIAQATFSENGLVDLCRQYSNFCGAQGDPVRNASIDLKPGGGIVYADIRVEGLGWQRVGVVLRVNDFNRLEVVGVDIDGTLYAAPPGNIGQIINEAESTANNVLNQLTMQAGGEQYRLSQVIADEQNLTLVLR
jgi:hypothetical protein